MSSMVSWGAGLVAGWLPALLLVLFITLLVRGSFGGRPNNFPPGMMILPVVGSLLSMPLGPSTETLRDMRKKYGDMASFAILGTRMVLVSSVSLMKEVFTAKATTARPQLLFLSTRNYNITDGRTWQTGITGASGKLWQENRRFFLHHMRDLGFGKSSYEPVMVEEIGELMDHLAEEEGRPLKMRRLFHRSVINILWGMFMGKRFPYGHTKLNKLLSSLLQHSDINEFLPIHHIPYMMKVIRFIPIQRKITRPLKSMSAFLKEEIKDLLADEELKNGHSFMALYLQEIEKKENPNFNMDNLRSFIFDLFVAGMETTSSTLTVGVYLLAKHPHVQRLVQEELDEVMGRDRLPSFCDMERLPYVHATISEVQRAFNFVKLSIPHVTSEDCKLGGYDIPKGTWLLPNLDDAQRNSEYWKNAREFDPQNFLDENGKYKKNDALLPFGIGKRSCAGEPLARMELFLFLSHLFQRFTFTLVEVRKPLDDERPMFTAPPEYTARVTCRPPK